MLALALFDTPIGTCGIAWSEQGVRAAAFPEKDEASTRARLLKKAPEAQAAAPPEWVEASIRAITALLSGDKEDLLDVRLDLACSSAFDAEVYALTRRVQPGATATYGDIARALGDVSLSRRVGQALGRNPVPIIIPCHRIVGADARLTGFSAPGGIEAKRRLLKIEGALEPDLFD